MSQPMCTGQTQQGCCTSLSIWPGFKNLQPSWYYLQIPQEDAVFPCLLDHMSIWRFPKSWGYPILSSVFDFSLTTIHFGDPPYVIRQRNSHIDPSWIFEATKSKNNYSTMDSSPDNLVIIKVVATLPPQLLCVYLRSWCYTSLCLFFRL